MSLAANDPNQPRRDHPAPFPTVSRYLRMRQALERVADEDAWPPVPSALLALPR